MWPVLALPGVSFWPKEVGTQPNGGAGGCPESLWFDGCSQGPAYKEKGGLSTQNNLPSQFFFAIWVSCPATLHPSYAHKVLILIAPFDAPGNGGYALQKNLKLVGGCYPGSRAGFAFDRDIGHEARSGLETPSKHRQAGPNHIHEGLVLQPSAPLSPPSLFSEGRKGMQILKHVGGGDADLAPLARENPPHQVQRPWR